MMVGIKFFRRLFASCNQRLIILTAFALASVSCALFPSSVYGDGLAFSNFIQARDRGHVIDEAGLLPRQSIAKFNQYLEWIFSESDVDIRFLFVPDIAGQTIEEFAVDKVEELRPGGLGKEARGLLLLYDVQAKRLRVEVGYGLEGYFTDAFLSYLTDEHTRVFFASGNITTGLRLLIRMLHHRIREAKLGNDFDPRVLELIHNPGYLSGGGGVTEAMSSEDRGGAGFRGKISNTGKQVYTPQSTPKAVYEKYLDWLVAGSFDPKIDIFTRESQARMARLPISPAYFHYILMMEYGKTSTIEIRNDVALQYFTDDPMASPHFYRKTDRGWQMDIAAEIRDTRNRVGGVFTWDYGGNDDIYTRTFVDKLVNIKNYIRIRGGDNRELPVRGHN